MTGLCLPFASLLGSPTAFLSSLSGSSFFVSGSCFLMLEKGVLKWCRATELNEVAWPLQCAWWRKSLRGAERKRKPAAFAIAFMPLRGVERVKKSYSGPSPLLPVLALFSPCLLGPRSGVARPHCVHRTGGTTKSTLRSWRQRLRPSASFHTLLHKIIELGRLDHPLHALARLIGAARNLGKSLVEGKVVADAVLPATRIESVKGIVGHDPLIDVIQCHLLFLRAEDRHADQLSIRMRRL
ncbi:hypothetical protein KC329_g26 [Hortaea werneckii]|nr:hypothetical protein KC329_g26 [Hortaea werneckii]